MTEPCLSAVFVAAFQRYISVNISKTSFQFIYHLVSGMSAWLVSGVRWFESCAGPFFKLEYFRLAKGETLGFPH